MRKEGCDVTSFSPPQHKCADHKKLHQEPNVEVLELVKSLQISYIHINSTLYICDLSYKLHKNLFSRLTMEGSSYQSNNLR